LACCSRIDHLILDLRSREALEFAARHVDTSVARQRGRSAHEKAAHAAWREAHAKSLAAPDEAACVAASCAANAATATLNIDPVRAADLAAYIACYAAGWEFVGRQGVRPDTLPDEAKAPERRQQAALFRCIFGNPFRPVALDPAWLTSTVVQLARGVYDDRAFDRLPILADALQDAGCDDEQVLTHLRGPGPHARGCWVVDLVLGKS
jgi:hypothetical protein